MRSAFVVVNGRVMNSQALATLDHAACQQVPNGYSSSAQAFNALARRFLDRHHIIAPAVRGHGESGWSRSGAYQYSDQVGDLAASVDKLGLSRFTRIGTSMGGIIAMAYAGAHPD